MTRITREQSRLSFQSYDPNGKIDPVKYRPRNKSPEHDVQCAIVKYLHMQYPKILVAASFNGAYLGGKGHIQMMRAKQAGLLIGLPDLCLICPNGKVIWIEIKSDKGVVSDAQREVHGKLGGLGHSVYVARSVDDVKSIMRMEAI